ncbi:MAG TPA: hypothetical protein VGF99_13360, partial [Myxococcota bacterium]
VDVDVVASPDLPCPHLPNPPLPYRARRELEGRRRRRRPEGCSVDMDERRGRSVGHDPVTENDDANDDDIDDETIDEKKRYERGSSERAAPTTPMITSIK